jgi:hypothetical protein
VKAQADYMATRLARLEQFALLAGRNAHRGRGHWPGADSCLTP